MASASTQSGLPGQVHPSFGSSTFEDQAFEPNSSYMFEDGDVEGFRELQQSIGLHMGTMDPLQSQYVEPLGFGHGLPSPDSSTWQSKSVGQPLTAQSNIVDARRALVSHNFGQITPPNDNESNGPSQYSANAGTSKTATTEASNAKSERARNAANQRHARKNQARKQSVNSTDSGHDDESEGTNKREKYREKNRLAAAKCRAKKKTNTEDLESQARTIQGRNRQLKEEELNLRDELSFLRNYALEHIAGGCQNDRLLSYNQMKAEEAARLAQMGHTIQSPSLEMEASPGSDTSGSRPQSSSDRRPSVHQQQPQVFGSAYGTHMANGEHDPGHQGLSPMDGLDHSLYDFARPTTQQALASMYATGDDEDDFPGYRQNPDERSANQE